MFPGVGKLWGATRGPAPTPPPPSDLSTVEIVLIMAACTILALLLVLAMVLCRLRRYSLERKRREEALLAMDSGVWETTASSLRVAFDAAVSGGSTQLHRSCSNVSFDSHGNITLHDPRLTASQRSASTRSLDTLGAPLLALAPTPPLSPLGSQSPTALSLLGLSPYHRAASATTINGDTSGVLSGTPRASRLEALLATLDADAAEPTLAFAAMLARLPVPGAALCGSLTRKRRGSAGILRRPPTTASVSAGLQDELAALLDMEPGELRALPALRRGSVYRHLRLRLPGTLGLLSQSAFFFLGADTTTFGSRALIPADVVVAAHHTTPTALATRSHSPSEWTAQEEAATTARLIAVGSLRRHPCLAAPVALYRPYADVLVTATEFLTCTATHSLPGALPVHSALKIGVCVAAALAHLHDARPMCCPAGTRLAHGAVAVEHIHVAIRRGAVVLAQLAGVEQADLHGRLFFEAAHAADVRGLGWALLEMLVGHGPLCVARLMSRTGAPLRRLLAQCLADAGVPSAAMVRDTLFAAAGGVSLKTRDEFCAVDANRMAASSPLAPHLVGAAGLEDRDSHCTRAAADVTPPPPLPPREGRYSASRDRQGPPTPTPSPSTPLSIDASAAAATSLEAAAEAAVRDDTPGSTTDLVEPVLVAETRTWAAIGCWLQAARLAAPDHGASFAAAVAGTPPAEPLPPMVAAAADAVTRLLATPQLSYGQHSAGNRDDFLALLPHLFVLTAPSPS